MNEAESLKNTLRLGFYRYLKDGKYMMTNGEEFIHFQPFAETNQHFEILKGREVFHLLKTKKNQEPWPIVKFTVDFTKNPGKIPGEPLINLAPPMPIQSENSNADTSIIWNHIENLCGDVEQDIKEWVKDWLADIFQNPHNKPGTALTFRTDEGAGKGLFFDNLMKNLLGKRHLQTVNSAFGQQFNGEAKNRLLINFNEGSWNNKRDDIGRLKSFITDPEFAFEEKYKDKISLPNFARCVFTSNDDWLVKNDDSRRFCMLSALKNDYMTSTYFKDLWEAINNDAVIKKFLYELENRKITSDLRIVPKTQEYLDSQILSYNYVNDWLNTVLETETFENGFMLWDTFTENIKTCKGAVAAELYNLMKKDVMSSKKLYIRIKQSARKFGYAFGEVSKRINSDSVIKIWEFRRILK